MEVSTTKVAPIKKQGTRLIRVACPNPSCGVILRMSYKHLINKLPTCSCGQKMLANLEPRMRPNGDSVELSTGESFKVAHMGILWALVTSAKRGLTTDEPFDMGGLRVTEIDGNGDIHATRINADDRLNYRYLIRFREVESVATKLGIANA